MVTTSRIQTEYAYKKKRLLFVTCVIDVSKTYHHAMATFLFSDPIENYANAVSRPSKIRMSLPEAQTEDEQRLRVRAVSVVHVVLNLICYRIN